MSCSASIAAITLWLAATGEPPGGAGKELTIGTEDTFPPYIIRDEAGGLTGFDHQVMSEICTRTGHDCTWEIAPFGELIPGVAEGRFDVVLGGMAITPERRALVDFSIPYTWGGEIEWFVGFPGAPAPEAARIAVEAGTIHESWLRDQGLDFRSYPSESAALDAVAGGGTDLTLGPFAHRTDLAAQIEGRGLDYVYSVDIPDEGTGIAVCKGNTALKAQIDGAIRAMEADGTLAALNSRWF